MEDHQDGKDAAVRQLHAGIERVRKDLVTVEFWADAVAEFAQPAPEYEPRDVTMWLPREQAVNLKGADRP